MTPKNKRDSLFRINRPNLRPLKVYDGDEYHRDMKILWVAYEKEPFHQLGAGLNQKQFCDEIEKITSYNELLIADDYNKAYKDIGPIAIIGIASDGWKIEPHVQFFTWATPRNVLRVCIAAFQFFRYSRKIGCYVVHALEGSKNLFDRCATYGVIHFVGKIVNGDQRGDEYIYSGRGKRNVI